MKGNNENFYDKERVESIVSNPDSGWKKIFKETIISMIATNKNELLWYANFLSRCEYEFHFNQSFISAVYFNGKNFVIAINPIILGLIHKNQIIAILKHSAGHIINHHFKRVHKDDSVDKEIIETAKDIVINGSREVPYIKDLPSTGDYKDSPIGALFYEVLDEKYGIKTYEIGREFEYYVQLMKDSLEEEKISEQACSNNLDSDSDEESSMEQDSLESSDEHNQSSDEEDESEEDLQIESGSSNGSGSNNDTDLESGILANTLEAFSNGECNIDNHEFGEELQKSVPLDENLLDSFMDTTLSELITDSTAFARGFTPSEAIEAQNRIEKRKSHKDWRKIFNKRMRNYISNSFRYREPNKSRQHPIYPDDLDLYGYTPSKKPKLAVVLDISGSMEDKLLVALVSELQAIQKKYSIKNITLVQVDAEIKSIEKLGMYDKFIVRNGGGGTIMEPGFKALIKQPKHNIPDIIICATDGDIEERFESIKLPNKTRVIWLVAKEGKLKFDLNQYPKHQMDLIKFSI